MQKVTCSECGLKYGVYSTFHRFPEDVERERRRHNCELIQLCRRWLNLIRGPFYWDPRGRGQCDGDPPDAPMQAAMVEAEDGAAVARVVFEARTAAYTRAEARACSWMFAAAQADRALRRAGTAVDEHTVARAFVVQQAALWAQADVAAKAEALDQVMDVVEDCARGAGVFLPSRRLVRDGGHGNGGCIVFEDVEGSDHGVDSDDSDAEDDSDLYVTNILNDDDFDEDREDGSEYRGLGHRRYGDVHDDQFKGED